MSDALDLVRALFEAVNRSDVAALAALYHPNCIVEHVFLDDAGDYEGVDRVRELWADEFARYEGALAGGRRFDVPRISGIETGWGWARADWRGAARGVTGVRNQSGYSHFWVEDGLIRRHRSVARDESGPPDDAAPALASVREYPSKPV